MDLITAAPWGSLRDRHARHGAGSSSQARTMQDSEHAEHRLAVLQRVVTAPPVEGPDLRRELVDTAGLLMGVLGSVGLLLAAVLGALWLLV